jgi:hypothetical protein
MAQAADSSPLDPNEEELTPELALVDPELALRARERLSQEPSPPPQPGPGSPADTAPAVAGDGSEPTPPPPRRRLRSHIMLMAAVAVGAGAVGVAIPAIFFSDSPVSRPVTGGPPTAGVASATGIAPTATATPKGLPASAQPRTFGWVPVDGARHYHVAFFRGRAKIFETWPRRPRVELPAQWTFNGRRERLSPGTYRWVVRPGFGLRRSGRYGRPIVDAALVIRR